MEEKPGQRGRGCFAAGADDEGGIGKYLSLTQALAVPVLSHHVSHKVTTALLWHGAYVHACLAPLFSESPVLVDQLHDPAEVHAHNEHPVGNVPAQKAGYRRHPDAGKDALDPRMVAAPFQAVERFGEHEVPNDVKDGEVHPFHDVYRLPRSFLLAELFQEQVDGAPDRGLLLFEGRLAKGRVELAALSSMDLGVGTDDGIGKVEEVIGLLRMVDFSVAKHLREADRAVYGQVIGTESDDLAVLLMEPQE